MGPEQTLMGDNSSRIRGVDLGIPSSRQASLSDSGQEATVSKISNFSQALLFEGQYYHFLVK